MTGIPHFNYPAFNEAAAKLRAEGYEVFNPAERDIERHEGVDISLDNPTGSVDLATNTHGFSRREAMADDTQYICKEADAIALLPNWQASKGAIAERALAIALGLEVIFL